MANPRVTTTFLLASSSPRRIELLTDAGFHFETVAPSTPERDGVDLTVRELTAWNAVRKAKSVASAHPDKVVLAADTLVAFAGEIIGKPSDLENAREILRRLSGNTHDVCSAVAICHQPEGRSILFHELSHVRFRQLSDAQICDYLAKINPLDKAGAYAAQGRGAEIIVRIEGSYSNVVGLPMEKTVPKLAEFGIRL
jgi:septum formation protein